MAGIDISKLKDAQFDDEEPKKTSSDMPLPAVPVSSPAPITHRQSQGNVLARADSLGLAANVGQYGLSVAKKSFKPMMIASIATNVLDLCQTIAQVHQNIRAEEEATKRYKIQADAFMGTQKEITARMHDAEETKRMQISKDYDYKLLSITKEMEAMKLAYQDKDKERGFRRDNLEHDYQSLSQALDYFLTKCQSCQDEYIKSHCKNEKLLEQLDEAEQKIMTIITLITHLDYSKGE